MIGLDPCEVQQINITYTRYQNIQAKLDRCSAHLCIYLCPSHLWGAGRMLLANQANLVTQAFYPTPLAQDRWGGVESPRGG